MGRDDFYEPDEADYFWPIPEVHDKDEDIGEWEDWE